MFLSNIPFLFDFEAGSVWGWVWKAYLCVQIRGGYFQRIWLKEKILQPRETILLRNFENLRYLTKHNISLLFFNIWKSFYSCLWKNRVKIWIKRMLIRSWAFFSYRFMGFIMKKPWRYPPLLSICTLGSLFYWHNPLSYSCTHQ